jgi:transcriptional regulatory protein RtcR
MATLAPQGRITEACVEAEIKRLMDSWKRPGQPVQKEFPPLLSEEERAKIDPFDLVQLDYVLGVCRSSKTISDAGRRLFAISRTEKAKANDADRLKKYLKRFGLDWAMIEAWTGGKSD